MKWKNRKVSSNVWTDNGDGTISPYMSTPDRSLNRGAVEQMDADQNRNPATEEAIKNSPSYKKRKYFPRNPG